MKSEQQICNSFRTNNTMDEAPKFLKQPKGFATKAIHVGQEPEQWKSMAVVAPISMSTTFKQSGPAQHMGFEYSRSGNPTRSVLEKCLAGLDNAKYALALSSGVGVITTLFSMLQSGDDIIIADDIYGGSTVLFQTLTSKFGVTLQLVDICNMTAVQIAIKPKTKIVWVETPSNPLLHVVDLKRLSVMIRNKSSDILLVVDNTFLTSYFQRPLELGAHMVTYSLTKYMNGHSDICMGAVCMNDEKIYEQMKFLQNACGIVPSPFDCYMVNRSLKTLQLRMEQHSKSALKAARFLESHPRVTKVLHPGLPSHPQHLIALRQMYGHSGMIAFYVAGDLANSTKFLQSLKLVVLCPSLGGDLSEASLPYAMSHSCIPEEERARLGITDTLIRLSIGLEDTNDLIDDLNNALNSAY